MKKYTILLLLIPALCITSCNNDDDNDSETLTAEGEWQLIEVANGFGGTSSEFEPGTIAWTFNDDNTVTIINYNTNENKSDYFESGVYEYHFEDNINGSHMCAQSLFIGDMELGCKMETDTQLIISQSYVDGDVLTFVK